MRTIGQTIKILRLERHLSQEQFANLFNVAPSTVGMWENDKRVPNEDTKNSICDYFNVDMNYLYGKTDVRNSYRENGGISNNFSTVEEAMEYIIRMPVVAAYGGYDLDKMSDEEIIEFANDLVSVFEVIARRKKQKEK